MIPWLSGWYPTGNVLYFLIMWDNSSHPYKVRYASILEKTMNLPEAKAKYNKNRLPVSTTFSGNEIIKLSGCNFATL